VSISPVQAALKAGVARLLTAVVTVQLECQTNNWGNAGFAAILGPQHAHRRLAKPIGIKGGLLRARNHDGGGGAGGTFNGNCALEAGDFDQLDRTSTTHQETAVLGRRDAPTCHVVLVFQPPCDSPPSPTQPRLPRAYQAACASG
jgi:hypothetical protein